MDPMWPPSQVLVSGGAVPTLGHLKRAIAGSLLSISADTMEVFKFQPQTVTWIRMLSSSDRQLREMFQLNHHTHSGGGVVGVGGSSPGRVGGGGSKSTGGKKAENITQSPYFVKEGDQFCVFSSAATTTTPSTPYTPINSGGGSSCGSSKVTILSWDVSIARPEDITLRHLREEEKKRKEETMGW